jgi:Uma2 family endonuclease
VAVEIKPPDLYRFSLDQYHQLVESGGLDEDTRIELIDGLLVDMSPKTREHEAAIRWLTRLLYAEVDHERFEVLVAAPLTLGASEPEPDLAVVAVDTPRPYHPGTAALVIEVSVSSRRRDLGVKPRIYAQAGVPLYWVIDVDGRRAVAHSHPGPDGYASVETAGPDGELTALHVGIASVSLVELFSSL